MAIAIANAERFVDVGGGIRLCYTTTGDPGAPPIVLIAWLGMQLHSWPDRFAASLADAGHYVIRFDNRDAGRSTHMTFRPPRPSMLWRGVHPGQYRLTDMARDTEGLLQELQLPATHLVGVFMGGMIAQTVAAQTPGRAASLTSLSSTTGTRLGGLSAPSTIRRMRTARPPRTRVQASNATVAMFRHIGSHGYPFDEKAVAEYGAIAWDRDPTAAGIARQLCAIIISGDRARQLRAITAPTSITHGDRDLMVHPSAAAATARAIPGARREVIPGLGHDLPEGVWPRLISLITAHVAHAQT
jgi:pimeloyl-ACP methyl ester carboxylesterase